MKPRVLSHSYPAKLLLLGEYTVLSGSRALALPIDKWQGKFVNADSVDERLLSFADHISDLRLFPPDAVKTFEDAVVSRIRFDSNIPNGYGVGSSGALCAATYEQFFNGATDDTRQIRETLARMESFFHGKSSGMDPLVSLKHSPVLREGQTYHILPQTQWPKGIIVFLIDSGHSRSTGRLVESFLGKCNDPSFVGDCVRPLTESVDHAISYFIDEHTPMIWEHLQLISQLQFQYFAEMIHPSVQELWEESLSRNNLVIKLCGAGGGGFYLGFAQNEAAFNALQNSSSLNVILIN